MRRGRNPFELLVALAIVGFIGQAIGSTAFTILIWLSFGVYALHALAPKRKALGKFIDAVGQLSSKFESREPDYHETPVWRAYLAICREDMDELARLLDAGVDPKARFPLGMRVGGRASTLEEWVRRTNHATALEVIVRRRTAN